MTSNTSPTPRKRKERKENADMRRQQLYEATLRSIVQNGLSKTTLATVAEEAGLSQGVAVFYFKSKTGLLVETLREQYSRYEANWQSALAAAGEDPYNQLLAIITADFAPEICNRELLSVWFAFWGELTFTPQYAEISAQYDSARSDAILEICERIFAGKSALDPKNVAEVIDTLTDGFWQKLHLYPNNITREDAIAATLELVAQILPK